MDICVKLQKILRFLARQFTDRVTTILITWVFVSATIRLFDKVFVYCWIGVSRKKCQKLVLLDPLQRRQDKSFTRQKAKTNHISKFVRQYIINSSSNDKSCFFGRNFAAVREVSLSISFSIKKLLSSRRLWRCLRPKTSPMLWSRPFNFLTWLF